MNFETIQIKGILNNDGFCIKKKKYNTKIIDKIKNNFTITKELDDWKKTIVKYELYYIKNNFLVIPKFYANKSIEITLTIVDEKKIDKIQFVLKKQVYDIKTTNFQFNGTLRNYQQECMDYILNLFKINKKQPKGGLLKFSCGMGKTIMAVYLSHILKVKTLIVVHLGHLLDQWIDDFKNFTDAKVGVIKQNKCELDNDVCVGMIQTICSRDYDNEIFKDFGLVIFDEVHHYGSKYFSNILMKTSFKYTIGLSATPIRQDDMMHVVKWFLGDIIYQMKKKFDYRILVKRIYFSSDNELFEEKMKKYKGKLSPDSIKMINNFKDHNIRNNIIINIIDILKYKGRKIFVFSTLVEHLKILKKAIDDIIDSKNENHMFKTSLFISSSTKIEKEEAKKSADIIFATVQIAEEALNISRLDTVIYAIPVKQHKRLEQSSGRILRLEKYEDLTNIPLVVDISDELSCFNSWSNNRNEYYENEGWYIDNYYMKDNKYIYKKNDDITKNPYEIIFENIDDEHFIEKNLIKEKKNDNCENNNKINENDKIMKRLYKM